MLLIHAIMIVGVPPSDLARRVAAGRRALWDPVALAADGSTRLDSVLLEERIHSVLSPWMLGLPQLITSSPEQAFKNDLLPRVPKSQSPLFIVDVGANTGQFAASIVKAGHRGVSFEPSPSTCARLRKRIQKLLTNPTKPSSTVRCAAVGAARGVVELDEDPTASSASFSVRAAGSRPTNSSGPRGRVAKVPVVRLDEEISPAETNFILKTDTQGFEMQVLKGAAGLLARRAVRLLMIELSNGLLKAQGSSPLKLMRWVAARGYDCTYVRFFAAQLVKAGGKMRKIRYAPVPLPPSLRQRPSVPFDELADLLKHVPPSNRSGWTDLLCWPANFVG